jgi:hypothetical protein
VLVLALCAGGALERLAAPVLLLLPELPVLCTDKRVHEVVRGIRSVCRLMKMQGAFYNVHLKPYSTSRLVNW